MYVTLLPSPLRLQGWRAKDWFWKEVLNSAPLIMEEVAWVIWAGRCPCPPFQRWQYSLSLTLPPLGIWYSNMKAKFTIINYYSLKRGYEGGTLRVYSWSFYQPPRENPWLEFVERQESAHPYHDWNEKLPLSAMLPTPLREY